MYSDQLSGLDSLQPAAAVAGPHVFGEDDDDGIGLGSGSLKPLLLDLPGRPSKGADEGQCCCWMGLAERAEAEALLQSLVQPPLPVWRTTSLSRSRSPTGTDGESSRTSLTRVTRPLPFASAAADME